MVTKGHTYLNKPAAFSCRTYDHIPATFSMYNLLLPPGTKELTLPTISIL